MYGIGVDKHVQNRQFIALIEIRLLLMNNHNKFILQLYIMAKSINGANMLNQ